MTQNPGALCRGNAEPCCRRRCGRRTNSVPFSGRVWLMANLFGTERDLWDSRSRMTLHKIMLLGFAATISAFTATH